MTKELQEYIIELDVFVCAKRELKLDEIVEKIMSSFADQKGIDVVISPLQQTLDRQADKLMGEMKKRDVIIKKLWEFQFYATCPKTNDENIMNQLYDNTWQQFKIENNL